MCTKKFLAKKKQNAWVQDHVRRNEMPECKSEERRKLGFIHRNLIWLRNDKSIKYNTHDVWATSSYSWNFIFIQVDNDTV